MSRARDRAGKLRALIRPDSGATDGERAAALNRLQAILEKDPGIIFEVEQVPQDDPVSLRDLWAIKRAGGSLDIHVEGRTIQEAIRAACDAYAARRHAIWHKDFLARRDELAHLIVYGPDKGQA
jgi:hypothetical protein